MTPQDKKRRKQERQGVRKLARGARTFSELVKVYLLFFGIDEADSRRILQAAREVAANYPTVDLWDNPAGVYPILEEVLLHTAQSHDPTKGPFLKLFRRNLQQRLHRDTVRSRQATCQERQHRAAYDEERPPTRRDGANNAYWRWAGYLYEEAVARLDAHTQTYIHMRLADRSVKAIAQHLGVPEKTLWNKYGGGPRRDNYEKLARRIRKAIGRMVDDLPEAHRQCLVRHLLDEAGLTRGGVEKLLGIPLCGIDFEGIPLLDEADLLGVLGWGENNSENFGSKPGRLGPVKGVCIVETPTLRRCG